MSGYTDRSRSISSAALTRVSLVLLEAGVDFRIIGGSAVMAVLGHLSAQPVPDYVGTLDVDVAVRNTEDREVLSNILLRLPGAAPDPDDSDRIWVPVDVDGEDVMAPIDVVTSQLAELGPASADMPTLPLPALLLSKMRPYENKGAKGKDGYDAYMLLAHAASSPEEIARAAVEVLPRGLAEELLKLTNVFFVMKRRAARDAAMLLRDYHGVNKTEALRDAVHLAQRFVQELQRLLGA